MRNCKDAHISATIPDENKAEGANLDLKGLASMNLSSKAIDTRTYLAVGKVYRDIRFNLADLNHIAFRCGDISQTQINNNVLKWHFRYIAQMCISFPVNSSTRMVWRLPITAVAYQISSDLKKSSSLIRGFLPSCRIVTLQASIPPFIRTCTAMRASPKFTQVIPNGGIRV